MNLGDRGFKVIDGKNGPFVREYEAVYISPTGRSVHWKSLNGEGRLLKQTWKTALWYPTPTIDEAVRHFQEGAVLDYGLEMLARKGPLPDRTALLDAIIAAEKLRS